VNWTHVSDQFPAPGFPVLAYYVNRHGNRRIVRAVYLPAKYEECGLDDDGEYDEVTDEYYWPEGWYEQIDNWPEYHACRVEEGTVTNWMPMPGFPEVSK
jgi:hypothetical protein